MSRRKELEERRRALLVRCDEQRAEIAYRFEQIRPAASAAGVAARASGIALNSPLAWLAAVAGIVTLLRPKKLLSWMTLATGALSLLSRATTLLRLFATLRALRSGFR